MLLTKLGLKKAILFGLLSGLALAALLKVTCHNLYLQLHQPAKQLFVLYDRNSNHKYSRS
jgi:hypothetical protein